MLRLVNEMFKNTTTRIFTFVYKNKQNEVSRHYCMTNFSMTKMYQRDIQTLKDYVSQNELEEVCKQELISSMTESLETNFRNSQNTRLDSYINISNNVRLLQDNSLSVLCYVIKKQVIEKVEYKKVNSSEKTIVKNKLRKMLRTSKIREFKFDLSQIQSLSIQNKKYLVLSN